MDYKEKFDSPVNSDETLYVYCNDTLTMDMELKPIRFSAKNIFDDQLCRLWLPGGYQLEFLDSHLTNSDGGVILRDSCSPSTFPYRSRFIQDFNHTWSPVSRRDFGAIDFCNFAEDDFLVFRFKYAFPLYFLYDPEYLLHYRLYNDGF
ncbi:hypothetical protein FO519_001613 [Halicephalobus sp. NKZ332]|nr:hypothetical protein FO519_001613 [Halicephalobus sp. NKZ332]